MENKLIEVAMKIILNAGDGRNHLDMAFSSAKEFNFIKAEEYLEMSREDIQKAHQAQTNVIQDEAAGIEYGYSLLFNHAQDTLMTIMSELRMVSYMIETLKIVDSKGIEKY